jgi:tetratricopeptide (TPR) repeat protein
MTNRTIQWILGALFLSLFFWYCNSGIDEAAKEEPAYLNLAEEVDYVGKETCQSCHQEIYQSFSQTGMGRSLAKASATRSDADFSHHSPIYDKGTDFYYYPFLQGSDIYVKEYRLDAAGDTIHQRTEQIDFIIGSGHHTNSHIIDINGYLYQAPVTYYTQDQKWDLAPGFRTGDNLRFSRALEAECLTCHNHFPEQVEGSLNKYSAVPEGIECERCHGPGEVHARERLAGKVVDTSKYIDYTIVNPRDLSRDLQMDLCQRCHLQGVAVLKDGKSFYDFKPGMHLEEVMNVFLPRYTNSHERFIMASQADRLRLSSCYLESDMTCITCHNPHHSVASTSIEQYNQACKNCHQVKVCSAPPSDRKAENDNCSFCHMPPSGSTDIPHVNITDHNISKTNIRGMEKTVSQEEPTFLGLQLLTKENPTALEMAEGYLALYDKFIQSEMMLDSVAYYLETSDASLDEAFDAWVHYHFARQEFQKVVEYAGKKAAVEITDPWSAYRIGEAFWQMGAQLSARNYFEKAVQGMPYNLDFQEKLGAAQIAFKEIKEAKATFEFIIKEHPKRTAALCNLGFILVNEGKIEEGEALYDEAIALDPDYEQALVNKAAVRMFKGDSSSARRLLQRVLELNPGNQQARQALKSLS